MKYKEDLLFSFLFLVTAVFLFWKCRYGIGNIDESFYLTVPYRLLQGDGLFVHEWHLSQMAGVLTMPFLWIFTSLNHGTDGIILAMRIFTTCVQCFIGIMLYLRMRKYHWMGAVCASLCFVLYIPFGIMALSYNSMGIMLMVLSGILILSEGRKKRFLYVGAGLCFAGAVLCCPYLVLVYILYSCTVLIRTILCKKKQEQVQDDSIWSMERWIFFTLGTVIAALLFTIFVLSRASLEKILLAFSQIMNDPEHPPVSLTAKLISYLKWTYGATSRAPSINSVLLALLAVCILDAKRKNHKEIYFVITAICTIMLMFSHYQQIDYINAVMWPVNMLALFIVLLTEEKRIKDIFYCFWLPGILYSYCLHLTSNQTILAICSASSVAVVGTVMMLGMFVKELLIMHEQSKLFERCIFFLLCAVFCLQLWIQADLRYRSVFWENSMEEQTELMEEGIQKGLFVTPYRKEVYEKALDNLREIEKYNGNKVLYLSENTWYYLAKDYEMATYSAWLSGVNEHSLNRLQAYYELSPDKLPDIVYADLESEEMVRLFVQMFEYEIRENEGRWILTK
ncbi:MAG: hypothetical protein E7253_05045 [Lachnospiraceae bacterium]|nr:hypothetical protein [Lachnospiraceae bacterium]